MNALLIHNKIRVLPESLVNKIAAGEVVERPASVVKELVENAIDAGSDQITVIIKEGGKSLIQVVDNGCGMDREDALLAFQRHTTSKISHHRDLENIRTLGFRGEALASIASVSRIEMRTATEGSPDGILLKLEAGVVKEIDSTASTRGTSIAVKNLFYNTPARRKFLRSESTEYRHLLNIMNRFTLAFCDKGFTLVNEGEIVFELKPDTLESRILQVLGSRYKEKLIPVSDDSSLMKITGFVGNWDTARKSRGDQYIFLNSRYINNKSLNHAILSAYGELLAPGQFPVYVIFLELDPCRVDVNVHPTKIEVKFADERLVYDLTRGAVKRALSSEVIIPRMKTEFTGFSDWRRRLVEPQEQLPFDSTVSRFGKPPLSQSPIPEDNSFVSKEYEVSSSATEQAEDEKRQGKFERVNVWQLHQRYILSQIKSGLIVIDQHAAHERILYERAMKNFSQANPSSQQLLFPQLLDFSPEDYSYLLEILPFLQKIGFIIKNFGGRSVAIEGIPSGLKLGNSEQLLIEIIDDYKKSKGDNPDIRENIARSFACRSAIKAGEKLTLETMNSLIDQLFATRTPYFCPHGRPIILTISLEELDKRFGRS